MTPENFDSEIVAALRAGRKIEAIKLVRTKYHMGLKEAKKCVEDYLERHPELKVERSAAAPGKAFMLMLIAVLTSIAYWIFQSKQ